MFQELFENYVFQKEKARSYGFKEEVGEYHYQKEILAGAFLLTVVFRDGQMQFQVWDQETKDEYVQVKMEHLKGSFVSKVRELCYECLLEIRSTCFKRQSDLSSQSQRLLNAVAKKYGDGIEHIFKQSPHTGVLRHPENKKWYGVFMKIDYSKLDPKRKGFVEVLNLKQEKVSGFRCLTGVYPAFHMNKQYWISLVLDQTLTDETILNMIDESWRLTRK